MEVFIAMFVIAAVVAAVVAALAYAFVRARKIDLEREEQRKPNPDRQQSTGSPLEGLLGDIKGSVANARKRREIDAKSRKYEALVKLNSLHDSGAISDEEFENEKRYLLDR